MLSGGDLVIITIIFILILLGAIMVFALPKVICPRCGNKVLIMHPGSAMQCEKCKTRFLIDPKTKEVKEILN